MVRGEIQLNLNQFVRHFLIKNTSDYFVEDMETEIYQILFELKETFSLNVSTEIERPSENIMSILNARVALIKMTSPLLDKVEVNNSQKGVILADGRKVVIVGAGSIALQVVIASHFQNKMREKELEFNNNSVEMFSLDFEEPREIKQFKEILRENLKQHKNFKSQMKVRSSPRKNFKSRRK